MKNYEKYGNRFLKELESDGTVCVTTQLLVLKGGCSSISCSDCKKMLGKWLNEEYTPQIDWSKVPVDTPVIVKDITGELVNRHFCRYEKGDPSHFVCFYGGCTSFTTEEITHWDDCKLARPEDIEKYSI